MIDRTKITGFDWYEGNSRKNQKHDVSLAESEQVFFNMPLLTLEDTRHSHQEPRFHALGKTDDERQLHITSPVRLGGDKIRIISAGDMLRKELTFYEKAT